MQDGTVVAASAAEGRTSSRTERTGRPVVAVGEEPQAAAAWPGTEELEPQA